MDHLTTIITCNYHIYIYILFCRPGGLSTLIFKLDLANIERIFFCVVLYVQDILSISYYPSYEN